MRTSIQLFSRKSDVYDTFISQLHGCLLYHAASLLIRYQCLGYINHINTSFSVFSSSFTILVCCVIKCDLQYMYVFVINEL